MKSVTPDELYDELQLATMPLGNLVVQIMDSSTWLNFTGSVTVVKPEHLHRFFTR